MNTTVIVPKSWQENDFNKWIDKINKHVQNSKYGDL